MRRVNTFRYTITFLMCVPGWILGKTDSLITVSVYGFESINVSNDIAQSLQEHIESRLPGLGGYEVVTRSDIDKVLEEKRFHQSGMCLESWCLAEAGTVLGVDKLITGTISQVGQTYSIVLKLIDVKKAKLESSCSRQYSGRIDMLFSVTESAVKDLLKDKQPVQDTIVVHDTIRVVKPVPVVQSMPITKEVIVTPKKEALSEAADDKKAATLGKTIGTGALAIFSGLAVIVLINSIL